MKIPSEKEIIKIVSDYSYRGYGDSASYELRPSQLVKACSQIVSYIKEIQFDENADKPEIDPNLITIAELEAKIKVYESVIESAGVKLGIKKEKK